MVEDGKMLQCGDFFVLRRWVVVLLLLLLASAFCFWFASVAPVRGGTYFLCRRKESKQRKRAHTASACFYPRAPNVPISHAATCWVAAVASASSDASPTSYARTAANRDEPSRPPCGKLCVGRRAIRASARTAWARSMRAAARWFPVWCEGRYTVCRKGACGIGCRLL